MKIAVFVLICLAAIGLGALQGHLRGRRWARSLKEHIDSLKNS